MGAAQAVLWKEIDSVVFLGEAFEEHLRKEIGVLCRSMK